MAVETRVIIDANASNAIKEITRLDQAAQDADTTIKTLDDQTVKVEVNADGMDELRAKGDAAIASVKALKDERVELDTGPAVGGLDEVNRSADSSKSVLANMVGNTTQDLGAMGGAAGSAGVAIGQMGEYMADAAFSGGKLSTILADFAAVGAPILAVSIAMKGFAERAANAAKVKAFRKEEVQDYNDALEETNSIIGAIRSKLQSDQGLFVNFFGKDEDVTGVFTALGLGVDQTATLIAGGTTAIDAWGAALRSGGADADAVAIATAALKTNVEDLDAAQANAALNAEFFASSSTLVKNAVDGLVPSTKELVDAQNNTAGSAGNASGKTKDLAGAYRDAADAAADLQYKNSVLRGDIDKADSYIHLQETLDDLKVKGMEAMGAVMGGAEDAADKMRDYQHAQNAAKNEVIDFNEAWGQIDFNKTVNMTTRIDRGEFDDLAHDLHDVTTGTKLVDVRIRTTVDQAWQRLTGTRFP